MKWLIAAFITLVLWGIWGVALKVVSSRSQWHDVYLATNTAIVIAMIVIGFYYGFPKTSVYGNKWLLLALMTGFAGTLGYIFLVFSLQSGGKASIVIPLTSLYPAITALLSYFVLDESLPLRKAIGILLAIMALVLLGAD